MNYLAIEEYHVRFKQGEQTLESKIWLRPDEEWEAEGRDSTHRLRPPTDPHAATDAHSHFVRLVQCLNELDIQPLTCGTCTHFRRSPNGASTGWLGYCSYRGEDADAARYPAPVALLAPDCHAYEPSAPDQPRADEQALAQEANSTDPEETRVMPTVQAESRSGLVGKLRGMLGLKRQEPEMVRAGVVERPGGQPCPVCGTRMTNRASVANMDDRGEERVLSVWRCPHCQGNYLDDWFEAWVGSRARDAERLYVVPPVEANAAAAIVIHCPRPDVKGCTCIANQHFDKWGNELEDRGRRIQARESVVSL